MRGFGVLGFWGYTNFSEAIINTLLFTIGRASIKEMLETHHLAGTIYIVVFSMFVIYAFLSVVMGLFTESYRTAIGQIGYPDDALDPHPWNAKEFILWLCGFLPAGCLTRWEKLMTGNTMTDKHQTLEDEVDGSIFPESARLK